MHVQKLKHHIRPSYDKSTVEITMQRIKDRAECLNDYFQCRKKKKSESWNLGNGCPFTDYHNNEFEIIELTEPKICRDAISIFLESIEEEAYLKDEKLLVIELETNY